MYVALWIAGLPIDMVHSKFAGYESFHARISGRVLDERLDFESLPIECADDGIDTLEG